MKRTTPILIAATLGIAVLVGCADTSPTGDGPTGEVDDSAAAVINFPNKFMNVAFKCMGVNGIYSHTRTAAPVVIANDPMCQPTGDN